MIYAILAEGGEISILRYAAWSFAAAGLGGRPAGPAGIREAHRMAGGDHRRAVLSDHRKA